MQECDFESFSNMIIGVADCYGQTLTEQGIAMRFKLLEQYDYRDVERAALSIMASRKYTSMPTPAEFLEHLGGGNVEDIAEVEAAKVIRAIGEHGNYNSVVFDDPTTQAVIDRAYGGWPKLCEDCGVEESEKWFRKEFAKVYATYRRQGVQHFGVLAGLHEIENTARGFLRAIEPPRLVGNPGKARAVMLASREGQQMLTRSESESVHVGELITAAPILGTSEIEQ